MPALVVNGVTITGVIAAPRNDEEFIERERAYDGTMLATQIAATKNNWPVQVIARTAAQLATIEAALAATPPVTCSGDLLGGSVSCHIEVQGTEPILGHVPLRHSIRFTLHEA